MRGEVFMRKFWLFLGSLAIVIGIFVYIFLKKDPISPSSYARLTLGMTQYQVEKVIGLPPGDYYKGLRGVGGSPGPWGHYIAELGLPQNSIPEDWYNAAHPRVKRWWGNRYAIEV